MALTTTELRANPKLFLHLLPNIYFDYLFIYVLKRLMTPTQVETVECDLPNQMAHVYRRNVKLPLLKLQSINFVNVLDRRRFEHHSII